MKLLISTLLFLLFAIESCKNDHYNQEPEPNPEPESEIIIPLENHGIISETPTKIVFKINSVQFKMIKIEHGLFLMGKKANEPYAGNYLLSHPVYLSDYLIGETEVTQELYKAVMGELKPRSIYVEGDKIPMHRISWYECQEFISRLNALTQLKFHLPSEAQWEYAARGGNKSNGYIYSGSNDINEVAWYELNSGLMHPVATKKPNELGIYDMSGNLWEWCQDSYDSNNDFDEAETTAYDPIIVTSMTNDKIMRGGSYFNGQYDCSVYSRYIQYANTDNWMTDGFRIALTR